MSSPPHDRAANDNNDNWSHSQDNNSSQAARTTGASDQQTRRDLSQDLNQYSAQLKELAAVKTAALGLIVEPAIDSTADLGASGTSSGARPPTSGP